MGFAEGEFIEIECSMWRASDNTLVSTTSREIAEKNSIYEKNARYSPQLVIVGKDNTLKGIVNAINGMGIGETKKAEMKPEEAFGAREADLVKVMRLADFRKRDIEPEPGMRITLDGTSATVKSVDSGRVVIDANHPLAGERLTAEIKVVRQIDGEKGRAAALAESYGLKPDKIEIEGKALRLEFGSGTEKEEGYFMNKKALVAALLRYIGAERVVVEEEYSGAAAAEKQEGEKPQIPA